MKLFLPAKMALTKETIPSPPIDPCREARKAPTKETAQSSLIDQCRSVGLRLVEACKIMPDVLFRYSRETFPRILKAT